MVAAWQGMRPVYLAQDIKLCTVQCLLVEAAHVPHCLLYNMAG
jgi:hypothetical protein